MQLEAHLSICFEVSIDDLYQGVITIIDRNTSMLGQVYKKKPSTLTRVEGLDTNPICQLKVLDRSTVYVGEVY